MRVVGGAAVLLPVLLWLLASPLSSGADEPAHAIRAASIAEGQLLGRPVGDDPDEPRTEVAVPATLAELPAPGCYAQRPEIPASCAEPAEPPRLPDGRVVLHTTSGRHPPAYYALAGLPYLLDSPPGGNYAPRVLSALACAAFLAVAFAIAARLPGPRLAVLGVLAAVTPMTLHLSALVNPNGLEIAAAICLWTAVLALARGGRHNGLIAAAGVSGIVMTLTRPVSALWLGLVVAAAAAVARPGMLRSLLADRAVRLWAAAGVAAAAASLGWLAVVGNPVLRGAAPAAQPGGPLAALAAALGRTPVNLQQMIGVPGWLDTVLPPVVQRTWLVVVGGLAVAAVATRRWRPVAVLAAVAFATVVVPAVLEALRYDDLGVYWQGRYTLPLAVGVPILAGVIAGESETRIPSLLAVPAALVLAAAHCVAFAFTLRRYVVGTDGPLNFLTAEGWTPPLPPGVLLVAFGLSQALLLLWLWWVTPAPGGGGRRWRAGRSRPC